MKYQLVMTEDDIPTIVTATETIGRALTKKDGELIVAELNHMGGDGSIRQQILDAVSDAIENCFEGT